MKELKFKELIRQEGSFDKLNFEEAVKVAAEKGLAIVVPNDCTLQIDIDSKEQKKVFLSRIERVRSEIPGFSITEKPSPSQKPGREHITLKSNKKFTLPERLFLQLYLGSDPTREFLSFLRYKKGDVCPLLFFEKIL